VNNYYLLIFLIVAVFSILSFMLYMREKHNYLGQVKKLVKKRKKKLLKG